MKSNGGCGNCATHQEKTCCVHTLLYKPITHLHTYPRFEGALDSQLYSMCIMIMYASAMTGGV